MEREIKKKYTTGQFAKHFNITKDTLFYYDKIGLFHPEIVNEKGYRFYTSAQLDSFWALHALREINIPIAELKDYFNTPSQKKLTALAKTELSKISDQIRQLQFVESMLEKIVDIEQELENVQYNQLLICHLDEEKIIRSQSLSDTPQENAQSWMDCYEAFVEEQKIKGPAFVGSILDKNDLLNANFEKIKYLFTYSQTSNAIIKAAGTYGIFYHKGSYETLPTAYLSLLSQITAQGYSPVSDAYEEYLVTTLSAEESNDYITKISIMIE